MVDSRSERRKVYTLIIVVASSVAFSRMITVSGVYVPALGKRARPPAYSPIQSQNDLSRWCMVWSLVDRGTFQIDEIMDKPGWHTIDHIQKDGHRYSSKPPFLGVLVAGLYWILKQITGLGLLENTHAVVMILLLIVNGIPMVISLAAVASLVEEFAIANWTRLYVLCSMASGTFLTTFIVTLNNHTPAACAVTFSLWAALKILNGSKHPMLFAIAGFFGGFAGCCELPALSYTVGLLVLLGRNDLRRTLMVSLTTALIPLAGFAVTNVLETGELTPLYAYFGTSRYTSTTDGQPTYWSAPQGIDRGLDSPPVYLLHMVIGHHGILSLSPIFGFTVASWFLLGRAESKRLFEVIVLTIVLTAVVLEFYLYRTDNYNYGGVTAGLRWVFWLIPLWVIGMIPALDAWTDSRACHLISVILLWISIFSAAWADKNPWQHPWLFELMEYWGWTYYRA